MNTITKSALDNMLRFGIGYDPMFFERVGETSNFPPHSISQIDEDHYELTLAIAGYRQTDIDITLHNDMLTITGSRAPVTKPDGYKVLYAGIALRDFTRQFKVGEHVTVSGADLQDGILTVSLVRILPEAMKPKKIAIGGETVKPKQPRLAA